MKGFKSLKRTSKTQQVNIDLCRVNISKISLTKFPLNNLQQSKYEKKLTGVNCQSLHPHWDPPYSYNGGQKCWDLSGDITKTSHPSPPTPNKVAFWAKCLEMSAFLATPLLGGVRGRRDEPKAEPKIVVRSRVLRNNYLEGLFTHSQVLLCSTAVLPGCRRLLFPLLHAYNKGNRRRLHASNTAV